MKRHFLFTICLFCAASLCSQNIVYTITGAVNGNATHLDSLLFENLDNHTRFVMGDLPVLDQYDIDLSSLLLVTSTGEPIMAHETGFVVAQNTQGFASFQAKGRSFENLRVNVYGLSGQIVFSQVIPFLEKDNTVQVIIPVAGVYIVNLSSSQDAINVKVQGSPADSQGAMEIKTASNPKPFQNNNYQLVRANIKHALDDPGFSYQEGDSIRVTAFLGGYYTFPHTGRIYESMHIAFEMLESKADSTGVSDTYRPMAEEAYVVLAYDSISGGTQFRLITDTIELRTGNILTLDLDTIGLIQKVVKILDVGGETIVETEPGYMDELFVNAQFNLDTRIMEPKSSLKSDDSMEKIIEALTDESGYVHPVKVIYYDTDKTTLVWSAFDKDLEKDHRENIIDFHEDFSGTDLYGKEGRNVHFYINQGHTSVQADAVFEFEFKHAGELTEDTKIKKGDLEFFKFYLDANAGFQTKLALNMNKSAEEKDTKRIFRMGKATAKFLVPPGVPVWITFSCDIYSDYHFKADASLNAGWGFESLHTLQAGGVYEKATNDFSPIWDYTPENTIYPLNVQGEVNAYARMEIYPRTDVRLYGFFGPYAEIVPFVKGEYKAALQSHVTPAGHETFLAWNSGIDLGLDLRVGTSLKFLFNSKDFSLPPINCFNWPLWHSPAKLELVSQLPSSVQAGETIQIQAKVTDHLKLPVNLCPVYFDGDGEFSKYLPISSSNGIVSIDWTPGNSVGKKSFAAAIYNADGTVIQALSGSTEIAGDAPVASFSASPTSGPAPLTVHFTDESSNNPTSWSWDFGDGTTSTSRHPVKTYNEVGSYNVKLTASNAYGSNTLTRENHIVVSSGGGTLSGNIFYLSDQTGNDNIFLGELSGGQLVNIQQITNYAGNNSVFAFDVCKTTGNIVFAVTQDGHRGDMYLLDPSQGNPTLIPNQPSSRVGPLVKWSPDGNSILFSLGAAQHYHHLQQAVINPDGTNYKVIINTNQPMGRACHKNTILWLDEGMYIGVTPQWSTHSTSHDLWFRTPSGTFSKITNTSGIGEWKANMNPDGTTLVFGTLDNSSRFGIRHMPKNGGTQSVIIPHNTNHVCWPNGWLDEETIIYTFRPSGSQTKYDLYIIGIDGSNAKNISNNPNANIREAVVRE